MQEEAGPGTLLKKARESRGLSIRDLSEALRLSEKMIQAMEVNNYTELPGPAYMRGYLRAYARVIRISEVEILRLYDGLGHTDILTRPTVKLSLAEYKEKQRSRLAYWIAGAIGILLMVLVAIWWRNQELGSQATPQTYLPIDESPSFVVPIPTQPEVAISPEPASDKKAKAHQKSKPKAEPQASLEVAEPGL